ncbi:MAG: hypothetical protein E6Q97_02345 [Desulfurellales bacterium]|nr:MAG: hypothetical protein E6Q97_02345 [Desulfurellales bacterium]
MAASEEEEGDGEGDKEDDGEGEGEGDGEGAEEAKKNEKKTVVRIGDTDYDVPLTATIPVTVDGEVEQATIQDMMNAYSSKASIRKEVEQAKVAKQEVSAHRRATIRDLEKKELALIEKNHTINAGRELLAKGNFEDALNEFFEFDADKWDRFDQIMEGFYTEFAKLDPNAKRAIQLDRKNVMNEMKARRATQATAMQAEINAFNQYKTQQCELAGLEEEEVEDAWDTLVEKANKGEFSRQQVENLQKATAHEKWNIAMSEALATKTRGKITEVIKTQFPKLENKTKEIIKEMEEKLSGRYLTKATKEDIATILVRDYNGGKPGKALGQKGATTNSLRDKAQPRHTLREAASQEDDLDDIYDQSGRDEPSSQVWGGQFHK